MKSGRKAKRSRTPEFQNFRKEQQTDKKHSKAPKHPVESRNLNPVFPNLKLSVEGCLGRLTPSSD